MQNIKSFPLSICDCGIAEYNRVLQLQNELKEKRRLGQIPNTVLVVEHQAVITLGARDSANKMLTSREALAEKNIDLVETRRGGGTTAHNPGQLVFYPILNLRQFDLGINEYIRLLEQIGIELLTHLSVESQRSKGFPGLWIGPRKIASIGVRVSKFITFHGMAINITNDLSIFDHFVPCGLENVQMTSVKKETANTPSMADVKKILATLLVEHFSSEDMVKYEKWS